MKMLHFWVIGVTLPTVPNTLSDLFQEASGFYSTEAEVLCALGAHPYFCHIPCPKMHYKEAQDGFSLHFHCMAGLAGQESALPCDVSRSAVLQLLGRAASCNNPTDPEFIWSHQFVFVKKP